MARTKRNLKKTPIDKVEKTVELAFSPDRRLTVSVGTCADYGKSKVGLALSENVKNDADPMELADEIFETISEKLLEKFDALSEKLELDEEFEESDADEQDDADEDFEEDADENEEEDFDEDENEEEDFTEEEIMKLKKADLVELIDEEELDVDIKGMKLKEIRLAVIKEYFDEDDDEGWDDEGWDDDDDEDVPF